MIDNLLRWVFVSGWYLRGGQEDNNQISASKKRKKPEKGKFASASLLPEPGSPKKKPLAVSSEKKDASEELKREECEFHAFPPESLETTFRFKFKVAWGYFKIAVSAVIKENLWFLQYLLKLEPGYSYFSSSKKTGLEAFFIEHAYRSYEDCWNRPISSAPASVVDVVLRDRPQQPMFAPYRPLETTEEIAKNCINLASYNYLGFGGVDEFCTEKVRECLRQAGECEHGGAGLSTGSTRGGLCGTLTVHDKLERAVAEFLGKEDCFITGMGFATNSTIIPCLIDPNGRGRGCLILSDALNHKSIVEGVRMSAVTVLFKITAYLLYDPYMTLPQKN